MPETPVTRRYSMGASVVVGSTLESDNLAISSDPSPGESGGVVMCDVVSELVDEAR